MEAERGTLRWLVGGLAVSISLFQLYTGAFGVFEAMMQRSIHLTSLLALAYLTHPTSKRLSRRENDLIDIPLALLSLSMGVYYLVEHERIVSREWYYGPIKTLDIVLGVLLILLVLEAARRVTGWTLPIISTFFIIYALYGNRFPSPFTIRRTSLLTLIDHMALTPQAILGIPTGVSATFVFLFILFGAFLEKTGGGRFIIELSMALVGRLTGGPAKVAVVSSSLFGTISGSSVANVYGTGTFTIPLMKRFGYAPAFAGAVEATASSGGQIMPPVMGAAAFIMAEFLGRPYIDVAIAAIIPAFLYYLAVFAATHVEAVKKGLRGIPKEETPETISTFYRGFQFFVPLIVLVYVLVKGYTPFRAAFLAIVTLVGVAMLRHESRLNLRRTWEALELGARNAIMIAVTCASAGIVVGVLDLTGMGIRFVSVVLDLSGGLFLPTLILIMVACVVLGMGMPTAPAYIIAALIGAPALVQLGVPPMAAHMFVFYSALLSAITPPVALAAYAGAAIAGTEPMRTGLIACRLGFVKFLVPFMFAYNPVLLMMGSWAAIITSFLTACLGTLILTVAFEGWFIRPASLPIRVVFGISGFLLMVPEFKTDLIGVSLTLLTGLLHLGKVWFPARRITEFSSKEANLKASQGRG